MTNRLRVKQAAAMVTSVAAVSAVAVATSLAGSRGAGAGSGTEVPLAFASSAATPSSSGGLSVELRSADGRNSFRVGESVAVVVEVSDTDGSPVDGSIDMGNGEPKPYPVADAACVQAAPTYSEQPSESRTTADSVYDRAGTYTVTVTVTTGNLCQPTPRETKTVHMQINIGQG